MPLLGFSGVASSSRLGFFGTMKSSVAASANSGDGKVMGQGPFGAKYYLQGALAGGICCSITHGALTPVDVVKTRIQLDPVKYNQGFIGSFKQVIAAEGAGALLTGLGPTAQGYFIQGWFKFGGVEYFKINITAKVGEQTAWDNRTTIYLASAAMAEFIADIFLCPYEACRIRLVSQPDYASSLMATATRMSSEMGFVGAFYSGFIPILFKQVPYTMAKFVVQGRSAEVIESAVGKPTSESGKVGVSLGSGVIAGVVAAIISHPADTLLSKMNKGGAGGTGGMFSRMANIAGELGFAGLCLTGLGARCVMIGTLTAGQFGIFDIVMGAIGAKKFHFHDPAH